ncbi:hypothetical protein [Pseudoalteromonas sp. SWXJZ10B]|uniref:hypothetical protein n=1 Tax=Pseudoalteromonas sp. SWXJZ10B TaxID=2792063 RepID=UPI0018CD2976|nr:hypothetical protein [Pseudoalteromonas sp. SWXJZ10B]MBH0042952.1 hypothetical protein [Pseudoalteromonas sp. SWXJZ10B]
MNKKYIIFAPTYNENVGGAIAMHRLCHLINKLGGDAYLWDDGESNFKTCEAFDTPTIFTTNLQDYIVVYMDVVSGNPLSCPHIVRWFLNKPGFFTSNINYGANELYFFFQEVFKDPNYAAQHRLYVMYFIKNLYKNNRRKDRVGSCYMMRKGLGRTIVHDLNNSILLDGKPHHELALIFNRTKYFYCYDLHSAYTYFASLCGCIPIVIPQEELNEFEWQPEERLRYGIAYGNTVKQVEYAKKTTHKLAQLIAEFEQESEKHVENFISVSRKFFKGAQKSQEQLKNERLPYISGLKLAKNKIILFGASETLRTFNSVFTIEDIQFEFIIDNDSNKHGTTFLNKDVYNPNVLFKCDELFDVLITSSFHNEIKQQLASFDNIENIYSIF